MVDYSTTRYKAPRILSRRADKEFKYVGRVNVYFRKLLLRRLISEAEKRSWPLSRLIVHLCETGIEGNK